MKVSIVYYGGYNSKNMGQRSMSLVHLITDECMY